MKDISYSLEGVLLAVISGAVTSGIGYTIWYIALRGLTNIQSAVVQLLVPVIAAFGGVVFVSEVITFRLSLASLLILGGILVVALSKKYTKKSQIQEL
jgi:drug/metabolite transporter (DMT)-like permease